MPVAAQQIVWLRLLRRLDSCPGGESMPIGEKNALYKISIEHPLKQVTLISSLVASSETWSS